MSRKIAVWSNAAHCGTGYGGQTAQLTKRLAADGYEVAVIANYGIVGSPQVMDGIVHYPVGAHPYSLDVANAHADHWFEGERGTVLVLYDVWPLLENPDFLAKHDAWYWTPIDHAPPPPKVQEFCRDHNVIAMSDFGREQLTKAGMPPAYTIPHGIDMSVFKPTDSDIRALLQVEPSAHLTTIVMANIGQVPFPRKMWFENLMAWRLFAEKHDDAYLYLHTQLRHPRGIDLQSAIKMWGLPTERVRVVDQGAYMSGMVQPDQLAAIYSASDVTLMATAGEGFGIPAVESAACGTPVIGSRFSAQIEVIGEAGWLVPMQTIWDYQQGSGMALPDVYGIVTALEESYEVRDGLRETCIEHAAQFDADKLYAEQWRPFLSDREPKPNRQQRRAQKRGKAA